MLCHVGEQAKNVHPDVFCGGLVSHNDIAQGIRDIYSLRAIALVGFFACSDHTTFARSTSLPGKS